LEIHVVKHYKELLLAELINSGWELMERNDGVEWWLEESWQIRSVKQQWGFELQVLFLVDPMFEGAEKSRGVSTVTAAEKVPEERPHGNRVAMLSLRHGRFDENLTTFINALNTYRSGLDLPRAAGRHIK
jgi:hypothetical protein